MAEHVDESGQVRPITPRTGPRMLVGRSREQELLRAQLAGAVAGRGSLVILAGEAGLGKTTLAENVCHEAAEAGAIVLTGRCYDSAETPPYGPWSELLEQCVMLRDRLPVFAFTSEPDLTRSSSRTALFAEMRDFLLAMARERPLVILLDDVHWADVESLELLRYMGRQIALAPILLVITYRNDEVNRGHPLHSLVPRLVREALAVRIDLSPLRDDDVSILIEHDYQLPASDARRLSFFIQQRAEGNPFFIGELLRSLEGSGLIPTAEGTWTLGALEPTRIPMLLRQVIDQRLMRLGVEAEQLLAIAAIVGQVVPFGLWAEVSEVEEQELLPIVERAIDAHILDATSDGLAARFTHELIREALYESVSPPRRRVWHRRVGDGLVKLLTAPDPDELAFHFQQAGDRRAVDWLTRSGERAQRAFAWRTAAQRYTQALDLLGDDDSAANDRGWLRFRIALLRRFEDPGTGVTNLEEAERLGRASNDAALVAYSRFYQGMLRCQGDEFQLGIAAEEAGIAMLDALSSSDRARLEALDTTSDSLDAQNGRGELTLALAENGRLLQARALGEQIMGLPLADTAGSRGDALYGLGYAYASLGQPEASRTAFSRARELFAAMDYRSMVTASIFDELTIVVLPYMADQPRERQRLEAELSEALAALHELDDDRIVRSAGVVSATLDGAWSEAFDMLGTNPLRFMRRAVPLLLAPIARHQGKASLAWSLVQERLPAGPDTAPEDSATDILPLRTLAVALALDEGDLDHARRWLAALDKWMAWSGSVPGQADAHLCWAAYHRVLGEQAQARTRAMNALASAESPRQPLTLLAAHRLLGEIELAEGRLIEADEQLTVALSLAGECGARHEQALTYLAMADLLRERGDLSGARAHLATVRSLCGPMNAELTLARADALENRMRDTRAAPTGKLPAGLSPREAEVLRLLATGMTNVEIADGLSLSPRTINAHLTNIYGKLGVTSRGAAIRFALDHDLQ